MQSGELAFSEASERNKGPILEVLRLSAASSVLEIGSGTGQHAVWFASELPHVEWQPSDRVTDNPVWASLNARVEQAALPNLRSPLLLDVDNAPAASPGVFGAVFSANTAHIMSWPQVQRMFALVSASLASGGLFYLYGPFNYDGTFTSESNRQFDVALRGRASHMGVRDINEINRLADINRLAPRNDHVMPANNRLLEFAAP